MRKILLALMLVSGLAAAAQAADWSTDGPPLPRFARLQNLMAPPADSMYSLGGYAPADPNMNADAESGPDRQDRVRFADRLLRRSVGWLSWPALATTGIIMAWVVADVAMAIRLGP